MQDLRILDFPKEIHKENAELLATIPFAYLG